MNNYKRVFLSNLFRLYETSLSDFEFKQFQHFSQTVCTFFGSSDVTEEILKKYFDFYKNTELNQKLYEAYYEDSNYIAVKK